MLSGFRKYAALQLQEWAVLRHRDWTTAFWRPCLMAKRGAAESFIRHDKCR